MEEYQDNPPGPKKEDDDRATSATSQNATTPHTSDASGGREKNDRDVRDGSPARSESEERKRNGTPKTYSAAAKTNLPQAQPISQPIKVRRAC